MKIVFDGENVLFHFKDIGRAIKSVNRLKNVEVLDETGYIRSFEVIYEFFEERYGDIMKDEEQEYFLRCIEHKNEDEDEEEDGDKEELVDRLTDRMIHRHL